MDARVPTGSQVNLLGTGSTSVKALGIGSLEAGRVALHANVGVSAGGLERELNYGGAVTISASPRLSFSAELVGRRIPDGSRTAFVTAPHPTLSGVETTWLASSAAAVHLVNVAPGLKWNLVQTWMLVANANVAIGKQGLTSPVTPFVGVEYAFAR